MKPVFTTQTQGSSSFNVKELTALKYLDPKTGTKPNTYNRMSRSTIDRFRASTTDGRFFRIVKGKFNLWRAAKQVIFDWWGESKTGRKSGQEDISRKTHGGLKSQEIEHV